MQQELWQRLCLAVMKEADPNRLLQLVIKLNSTLEEQETERQRIHSNYPRHDPGSRNR
jgi:hypothetical protein